VEQTLTTWLIPAVALFAGVAIGFLVARVMPGTAPSRTQRQLEEIQERFDSYQSEVVSHFNTTATLVRKLTQTYQDVQEHLSEGANRLALDENSRQRLLAALEQGAPSPRDKLTPALAGEAPKDYAPKEADEPGTLDASFGLRK
jgi:uncharacterized membrane-anchored protein YhcB (DUF1043 family)